MLKFIRYHLETIAGIEIYPLVSFLIFFVFFLVLLYLVFSTSQDHVNTMSQLPLEDRPSSPETPIRS